MLDKEVILTKEGRLKLEEELSYLKTVTRKEIAEKIKVARSFGDLSENAEYDEAKSDQAYNEERIMKIENMLMNAQTIDESAISKDTIGLGSIVSIRDLELEEDFEYTIVGSAEADPVQGFISNVSPVGHALLGRKKGDLVEVDTPDGVVEYKVLSIGGLNDES
ncbi:MAG: transcription elongation factor GreA [Tissierellia bacterium]|nr:transcription elongation factor GreA [Tissierellia bacterium]